jgi:hypothetical protein
MGILGDYKRPPAADATSTPKLLEYTAATPAATATPTPALLEYGFDEK